MLNRTFNCIHKEFRVLLKIGKGKGERVDIALKLSHFTIEVIWSRRL